MIKKASKKKIKEVKEMVAEVVTPKITPLEVDFGREDLNKLRDKVNEIINELR